MIKKENVSRASAVIIVRAAKAGGSEIFLTHQADKASLFAGSYGFPGGAVQKEDCSEKMLSRCHGFSRQNALPIVGAHLRPQEARGFWVAAMRHLFIEVGILLAVDKNRRRVVSGERSHLKCLESRELLQRELIGFPALLEAEDLYGDAQRLIYFSRWQYPAQDSLAPDTCFYLTFLPDHASIPVFPRSRDFLWISPDRGLRLCEQSELPVPFPVYASIRTLADFDSFDILAREYEIS